MKRLLWIAGALVLVAGTQLFVFTEETDRLFAWTIQNPLTAAFLGGSYWSSCVLVWTAARERWWARARIAVPAMLFFTTLTLGITWLHLDQFHLGPGQAPETVLLTWVWLGIYLVVPAALLAVVWLQSRVPGIEPTASGGAIPIWLRGLVSAQSALLVALGVMLFVLPGASLVVWPWTLTPLAARAAGAWLLGLGVAAAQGMLENDWARVQPLAASCVAFALLQGLALVRYPDFARWASAAAWIYVVFLGSLLALGLPDCARSPAPSPPPGM
jgi:hypothetical protein